MDFKDALRAHSIIILVSLLLSLAIVYIRAEKLTFKYLPCSIRILSIKLLLMRAGITILFILMLHGVSVGQKKFTYGIKTGLNASVISASVGSTSSFRSGFHFGGYAKRKLSKSISLRPELYFSSQGEKDVYKEMPSGTPIGNTTTKINYINLPLMVQFGNKLNFHAGMQVGFLLSSKEEGEFGGAPYHDNLKDITKPIEYSYVLGIGYDANHFTLGARINMGISEIFTYSDSLFYPSMTHKLMHFYVGYSF
jgi:hypothetical protein